MWLICQTQSFMRWDTWSLFIISGKEGQTSQMGERQSADGQGKKRRGIICVNAVLWCINSVLIKLACYYKCILSHHFELKILKCLEICTENWANGPSADFNLFFISTIFVVTFKKNTIILNSLFWASKTCVQPLYNIINCACSYSITTGYCSRLSLKAAHP